MIETGTWDPVMQGSGRLSQRLAEIRLQTLQIALSALSA